MHESIIINKLKKKKNFTLKLDFLNESDNELEENTTDSDINSSGGESEDEYDENARY